MSMVWMTHPNLPDQPIHVTEESVPIYRGSGWQTFTESGADEPEPPQPAPALAPADIDFTPGHSGTGTTTSTGKGKE